VSIVDRLDCSERQILEWLVCLFAAGRTSERGRATHTQASRRYKSRQRLLQKMRNCVFVLPTGWPSFLLW